MEKPFGAVYAKQKANVIPTLHYRKKVFQNKMSIDQFLAYSKIRSTIIATIASGFKPMAIKLLN